ncbi:MAG: type II toxin-antitoxin system VapC family toxin [Acidobacteriia bacterium]|nr:type II toxin-antitoxin system VapC family toxin [Terriglobia bacterium]
MIAVDSNILVYAHRADSEWHAPAAEAMKSLAEGRRPWAIPWPCIHEFLAIVTNPRVYDPPSTINEATEQVEAWMGSTSVVLLCESSDHWTLLKKSLIRGKIRGPMVHDARIAAICSSHGISELWTSDRDFSRFPTPAKRNPLLA